MGTKPLRSPEYWESVDQWRKREAYIVLERFLLGYSSSVRQWDCFLFRDFLQRQRATITFVKRHLPLSDDKDLENFDGTLEFDWDKHRYSPKKRSIQQEGGDLFLLEDDKFKSNRQKSCSVRPTGSNVPKEMRLWLKEYTG